jgi:positive regulator of sigma E activity
VAHSAVLVRVAGTSVVGYILSGASLLVLAWWWLRTYRRKSRGRHAR